MRISSSNVVVFQLIFFLPFLLFTCKVQCQQQQEANVLTPADCGTKRGCWLVPPGCQEVEDNNGTTNCTAVVTWTTLDVVGGIQWTMRIRMDDLRESGHRSDTTFYGALGFSLDQFMGNDTVIACTVDNTGYGGVFLAWNDHTANYLQLQATEALLSGASASLVDGHLTCQGRWEFNGHAKVLAPNYLHDLSIPNASFHFLLARGFADPRTHQLYAHSAADGAKFPWISTEPVTFCREANCSQQDQSLTAASMPWLNQSHQSVPSRTAKLGWATLHGLLMSLCVFVLIPLGIFSARFGKQLPRLQLRIGGMPIWFQVHRACMAGTFLCMTTAFFGVFWQQNFRMFTCSTLCLTDDFNKSLHALIGTIVYTLCCLQMLLGIFRPTVGSARRPLFNFVHTANGVCCFFGAGANAALSTSIGKTGFLSLYGKFPHSLMAGTFVCLLLCFALCQWLTRRGHYRFEPKADPARVQPMKELPSPIAISDDDPPPPVERPQQQQRAQQADIRQSNNTYLLLLVLALNSLVGLAALGLLWAMLLHAFRLFAGFT